MSIQNSRQISDVKVLLKTGVDGSSIESIEKTGTSGLVDTYTVTLTNGEKTTFDVTNGNGIESIEKTDTQGLVDTYTITFENGQTTTYQVTNGSDTNAQIAERVENPATNAYAIGDYVVFNDQLCQVIAPIAVGGTFVVGTNLVGTTATDEIKEGDLGNINLLKSTVGWTGKNLLKPNREVGYTQEINGVTYIVNDDYSITGNGTASAGANLSNVSSVYLQAGEEYILSGGANLQFYYKPNYTKLNIDASVPRRFIAPETGEYQAYFLCGNGTTLDNVTIYPMLRKANILDHTYEPYHKDVVDVLREGEVIKGKNLLENPAKSATINNVTFTVNTDGSISTSGTANADAVFRFAPNTAGVPSYDEQIPYEKGEYKYTCLTSAGGDNTYYSSVIARTTSGGSRAVIGNDKGSGVNVSIANNTTRLEFNITIKNGVNSNGLTFKPMICTLDEWNKSHDFEPYFIPLKDSMFPRSEQRVLGAKNLLKITANSTTIGGVTYTINSDGSVVLNSSGSISANADLNLSTTLNLKAGQKVKVNFADADTDKIRITIYNNTTTSQVANGWGTDVEYTAQSTGTYTVYIRAISGKSFSNDKIWPMVRLASDKDASFAPYAMTNKELTDGLAGKQNILTFDNAPTSGSSNPVKSGGVYSALQDRQPKTLASPVTINGASRTTVEQALGAMADTALTQSGLSVQMLNCSITGGGYKEIGNKMVLVQIAVRTQVTVNDEIVVSGFPSPACPCALSAVDTKDNTLGGTKKVVLARINAGGQLAVVSDSDATLKITGVYCKS